MNIDILGKTHIVGLNEHSLQGFQSLMLNNINWDSQVKADHGQSKKNTVLLELPIVIRRDIQIEKLKAGLDTQIDFELVYQQDIGKLTSSLALDTLYLLSIDDHEVDLWSVDSELVFLPESDRNQLKHLMRNCDELFHIWVREIKNYLNRLTDKPLNTEFQDKVRNIVGYSNLLPKTFG
ncbi:hypothetical protein [Acinetobacter sp. YH01009]|uniref:hypothetical protein n=1 Tax=Acinetobacter TaxID=469 RepID=UPI0015D43AED|nr:hypothetical protein [Acinetobacter sp. YH01009]